jgi:TPR repeat protein
MAAGDMGAAYELGFLYHNGLAAQAVNFDLARTCYVTAIQAEPAVQLTALNNLGIMFDRGQGCPAQPHKARQMFLKAAVLGHLTAMANLAQMYEQGRRLATALPDELSDDDVADEDPTERETAKSQVPAMHNETGTSGMLRSVRRAMNWYDAAAKLGDTAAKRAMEQLMAYEVCMHVCFFLALPVQPSIILVVFVAD